MFLIRALEFSTPGSIGGYQEWAKHETLTDPVILFDIYALQEPDHARDK